MISIITRIILLVSLSYPALAQNLVSTSVLPRNAVLEMFNGINCAFCPDGDMRAALLQSAFPGRTVVIIIHTGPLADTFPGQPDYRTSFGAAIDSLAGGTNYPSGTMNRVVWPGTYSQPPFFPQNPPNNLVIRRPGWWDNAYPNSGTGADIILNGGNTPVNIGAETIWNDITRELTINVELYYTSTENQNNKLNVAFLENFIVGIQSTPSGYDSSYVHDHMLRHLITGQWGDTVTTTTQGTLVTRTYSYIVPAAFNIDNSELAIFVTQNDNKHTHTSVTLNAKNGTTVGITDIPNQLSIGVFPNPAISELTITGLYGPTEEITIVNLIGKTILRQHVDSEVVSVNVAALPAGLYFVVIRTGGETLVKKFIKE